MEKKLVRLFKRIVYYNVGYYNIDKRYFKIKDVLFESYKNMSNV